MLPQEQAHFVCTASLELINAESLRSTLSIASDLAHSPGQTEKAAVSCEVALLYQTVFADNLLCANQFLRKGAC